jgi:hypothetical protein
LQLRLSFSIGITAAIATVVFGCGADNGGGKTATSPSKAEFIRQANSACARERSGLKERLSAFERFRAGEKPEPYADAVHFVLLPTIEEEIARVEELDPPGGEEERVDTILFAQKSTLDSLAVKQRVASISFAEKAFAAPARMLRAYGLASCAYGNASPKGKNS